jgi:hypothetical protein
MEVENGNIQDSCSLVEADCSSEINFKHKCVKFLEVMRKSKSVLGAKKTTRLDRQWDVKSAASNWLKFFKKIHN